MASGLWPIGWIILTAAFFYNLTVEAGQSGVIQELSCHEFVPFAFWTCRDVRL
jgi:L-lactate permease